MQPDHRWCSAARSSARSHGQGVSMRKLSNVSSSYGVAIALTLGSAPLAYAQPQPGMTPVERAMAEPRGTPLTQQQMQELQEQALRVAQPYFQNGSQMFTLPKEGEPGANYFQ